jgi:hypothetical protein
MLRLFISISLVFLCSMTLRAAEEKPNTLKLDSGATITAPDGYTWIKTGEQDIAARKIVRYVAIKEGSPYTIFLAIDPTKAETEADRSARLKGFYNGTLKAMQNAGATDIKAPAPDLKPPIPDRTQFLISMKMKEKPFAMCGLMVFGKSTYHLQCAGGSDEEALTLAKSAETLKE